jgi:hypothetical protein
LSKPNNVDKIIRGDNIKKAFEQLDFLDQSTTEIIIKSIERNKITLDDEHHYSIIDIEHQLSKILGEHAARLIVSRLQSGSQGLKSIALASMPIATLSFSCVATTCACVICEFFCKCTTAMTMV